MDSPALLRLLGDGTRLRLLRLLSKEPLNVSELTAALGVAQSGVSRHLRLLRESALVVEERAGTFAWYRLAPPATGGPHAPLWAWLSQELAADTPERRADDARLAEVRRVRKEDAARHGAAGLGRQLVPGRGWAAWSRALGLLLPPLEVADLGCGDGFLTLEAARWARRVTGVDRAADALARARALAARRRVKNAAWKRGELERLPLGDASIDVALLSQALHHAADPARALAEAHRILRPSGRVLVLDLREHRQEWVQQKLGDRWLGFSEATLRGLLRGAGFTDVRVEAGSKPAGDPFAVLIAAGTKA
jgi:ArsR family transcriptional regulator